MQDEERYMTLNVQLKKRSSIQTSQLKCQDCSVVLRWYKILLRISGTVNGILVLTLITLFLLGFYTENPKTIKLRVDWA
ncbi:killer cell lectin-like receptor subfamily F member 1 isoform X4 [Balaenoptera acutorostrata]|uniref:Killer cell lectin-like receptor subfamily F member 1 isoform X4 n=1 Tax=Balaenoptera acutorostrata TaxID=9767 RepID=A0A452C4W4_BALAC|nr:killer cell lectin-like receptor subfamily F member 1 isoform X4 [Balaenoptera acutorostrata]